ncbi:MAG TPA: hypothetical protein VFA29_14795 [Candidatus Baltobacteraceae bacterium]|nr:hypothetical protein [Candidatus Baltobacteraceae bacterium]
MRVAVVIPAALLAAAVAARLLLVHHPLAIAADLAQPLAVVTYWNAFGGWLFAILAAAIAAASTSYVQLLRTAELSVRKTALVCAFSCAAALSFPVVFSSDVYAYAGYGDMALHGLNPYAHAFVQHGDALLRAVIWQWGNPPPVCVYGEVFVRAAEAIVAATLPLGPAAPLWALRLLACAALVACAPLAHAAFAPLGQRVRTAAAIGIALNPVAIVAAASGHNDVLAIAAVLGAFAAAARSRWPLVPAAMMVGALIKAPAFAAAAGLTYFSPRDVPLRRAVAIAAVCTVLALAASLPLLQGVRDHVLEHAQLSPQFSLSYVLAFAMPAETAFGIVLAGCALIVVAGAVRLLRGDPQGAAVAAAALWLAIPNPHPWYGLWLLPAAFLGRSRLLRWSTIATSLTVALRDLPDATWRAFPPAAAIAVTAALLAPGVVTLTACTIDLVRRNRPAFRRMVLDFAPLRSR